MGKSFFHSLFFMEKRHNCLKVVAASHQFAPSLQKRRVRVTVTRLFHQDLAILSFALGSLPQGGGSKSALAKANRLFESSSKEKYVRRSSRDDCDSSYGLLVDRLFVFLFRFNKLGTGSNGMFYIIISLVFIGIQLSATLSLTTLHGRMKGVSTTIRRGVP